MPSIPEPARTPAASDVLASRRTGAPMIACLLGANRVDRDRDGFALALDPGRPAARNGAGLVGLVTLADLALGGAIRKRIGKERGLQTVSLTMQLGELPRGPLVVRTQETLHAADSLGATRGQAFERDTLAADFMASFNIPAPGAPLTPLPWEDEGAQPEPELPLEGDESSVAESIDAFARGSEPGQAWADLELARACTTGPGYRLQLRPTIAMLNRFGYVQGAVLFCLAASDAALAIEPASMALRYGHIDFVSAAHSDAPTMSEATVQRSTKSTAFVATRVTQGGELVASGSFVFRARR